MITILICHCILHDTLAGLPKRGNNWILEGPVLSRVQELLTVALLQVLKSYGLQSIKHCNNFFLTLHLYCFSSIFYFQNQFSLLTSMQIDSILAVLLVLIKHILMPYYA